MPLWVESEEELLELEVPGGGGEVLEAGWTLDRTPSTHYLITALHLLNEIDQ